MKKIVLAGMACAALLVALPETALAHGGQYRGPGDVTPPDPGGGGAGPKTSGPGGPNTPGPTGPTTPGAAGPGGGGGPGAPGPAGAAAAAAAGPTTGRGGIVLTADLTQWQFWWEFNKDPYIRLKEAIHSDSVSTGSDDFFMGIGRRREAKDTLKPSETQIMQEVLPALKQMIDETDQRDIVSSVLVAMGKIGKDHPDFEILPIMEERLISGDQEIRETAALAMGISQLTQGVDSYLVPLVEDREAGRTLARRNQGVDYRTRSFAAYGLGLVANSTSNVDVKSKAFEALKTILEDDSIASRDVRVAAINGMSLLAPNPEATDAKEMKLFDDVLEALETYYMRSMGAGDQMIQSHVPTAIAKILGANGPEDKVTHYKDLFLAELQDRSSVRRQDNNIFRSAALALGKLAKPNDGERDNPDVKYSQELLKYYQNGKDQQAKMFTLIALAQIGGDENRAELLKAFDRGSKAIEKPWAALALGVYAHHTYLAAEAAGRSADPDPLIGSTLHKALAEVANPPSIAALAIGLGLCRYNDAADDLRDLLIKHRNKDELAGYLCVGLALMDDQRSKEDITDIVASSVRRPGLLSQAAIALGKLGDKGVTDLLQRMMGEGDQTLAKMSAIASALGYIGDRRTIGPLKDIMFDNSATDLTRAFAAVALGGVADKEDLPWNSKIGADTNYRAAVETLTTSSGTGILDIL